jgi:hypothetical protein
MDKGDVVNYVILVVVVAAIILATPALRPSIRYPFRESWPGPKEPGVQQPKPQPPPPP